MFFWKGVSMPLMVSFFLLFFFCFSFFFLFFFIYNNGSYLLDWQLLAISGYEVSFSLLFDWVSFSFSLVVYLVSFSVIWFSFFYMVGDQYVFRFSWLVILFVTSMIFMIFVPNLISLLVGWDGLGITSFCLIIYYQNYKSLVSGFLTILMNRIGDVMVLLSIGWMVSLGSWGSFFWDYFYLGGAICFCIVLAGATKSAQFPFCSWLPAAMAAPTPVSALVHSSTLVTAGVFLVIRFWEFISNYYFVVFFLQLISLVTMLLAGFSALFETDLKKIIALSTLSQLSIMLFAVSFGFSFLGLFHLYTHALFKALLFLCAGCLIHFFSHAQDIRNLGSCWSSMPCVMFFFSLANLALCGFPFFGGYYSKDMILEVFLWGDYNFWFFFFLFVSTLFTVSYSVRVALFSFFGASKIIPLFSKTEEDFNFLLPLVILGAGALFGGFFFFLFVFEMHFDYFFASFFDKIFIFFVLGFGVVLGVLLFYFFVPLMGIFSVFSSFSDFGGGMWFLQPVSTQGILKYPFEAFFFSFYLVDRGYLENLSGQGISCLLSGSSSYFYILSSKSILTSLIFLFFFTLLLFFN